MKNVYIALTIFLFFNFGLIKGGDLPTNSLQKSIVGNWWLLGPFDVDSKDFQNVGKVEKDPFNYFNEDSDNVLPDKLKKINSDLIFGFQPFYQLYDEFKRGSVLYAFSYLESKKNLAGVDFVINSGNTTNIDIFINGVSKATHSRGNMDEVPFKSDLKKGRNTILLKITLSDYNPNMVNVLPRFFLWAMPPERVEIFGTLKDSKGSVLPNHSVQIYDGQRFYSAITDKNGRYERSFYPFTKNYQTTAYYNGMHGYSKSVSVSSGKTYQLDLKPEFKSKFYGTVKNIDGNTPQPGIRVRLENINNNQNFSNWISISDQNGYFSVSGIANGSYNAYYFSDNKKTFIYDKNGDKKVYKFENNTEYEENFTVLKQVKGSWKNINLFDGMLSSAIYDLMLSSNGKIYMGTYNGLSIYDGQNVVSYNYKNGLPNDALMNIFEDKDGDIWLG